LVCAGASAEFQGPHCLGLGSALHTCQRWPSLVDDGACALVATTYCALGQRCWAYPQHGGNSVKLVHTLRSRTDWTTAGGASCRAPLRRSLSALSWSLLILPQHRSYPSQCLLGLCAIPRLRHYMTRSLASEVDSWALPSCFLVCLSCAMGPGSFARPSASSTSGGAPPYSGRRFPSEA
jgi:hypothetical protein